MGVPRQSSDFFGNEELDLIYIAKRLHEARSLEQALETGGIDYLVETDTYRGGFIFQTARVGAFFYVRPADLDRAHAAMRRAGYRPYEP